MTLKIQKHSFPAISPVVNGFIPNDNHLLKIVSGRRDSAKVNDLQDIPHAVMFLSLDISSEDEVEKVCSKLSILYITRCFDMEDYAFNTCMVYHITSIV